jgi:fatty-acyl-CoA synthase
MRVPLTTVDFLRRAEQVYGDRIGLIDEPEQPAPNLSGQTYGSLAERCRAVAAGLDALGVAAGERVAIVSENAARFVEVLFGVTGSGRVCVPINFRLQTAEIAYIIEHSGAGVVFVDPDHAAQLKHLPVRQFVLGFEYDESFLRFDREPALWEPDEDATATINYTSGTTARPKGVQITHRNIWVNAMTFGLHTGVTDRDVYLHTLPLFHCNGWGMPFAMAGMGVPQVILRKVDGTEILRRIEQHGVTIACGAPAVWNAVLDAAAHWDGPIPGRDRMRIVVAGAPPPTRTIARVQEELGWEFTQLYGLTETSPLVTWNRTRSEWDDKPALERAHLLSRAGAPAIGTEVAISDSGEVLVRSNTVLEGYWNQPETSAEALEGGWFHTGDGGHLEDGYLTISDRRKDVIITGGENVSSIEVEDAIFSHEGVAEVAVIGVPDDRWGETVKALVVVAEGHTLTQEEIISWCKERLARFKAPTSVDFVAEIPRTATGKVQKFKLREPFWRDAGRQIN